MSQSTVTAGDFDDFEFEALVADFHEQPAGHRPSRAALRREGREQIDRSLGIVRHRSREREA